MAKKLDKKNKSVEPTENKAYCQYCKKHCNRPSTCKETGKPVARKQAACDKFKN